MRTELDKKFYQSTRGRIVLSLREGSKTVNDLAAELGLTDNAVRSHLATLERDRLVEQGDIVKGHRKPHFSYRLTEDARHLFPTSYHSLLNRTLDALKRRWSLDLVREVMRDVGRSIGLSREPRGDLEQRIQAALDALADVGGRAALVEENGMYVIKSEACPFAEAVTEHPEVCKMAESMVAEVVGRDVHEVCDRSGPLPKCRFEIEEG
jgi:predicted ArsR family transcriptional regulator